MAEKFARIVKILGIILVHVFGDITSIEIPFEMQPPLYTYQLSIYQICGYLFDYWKTELY